MNLTEARTIIGMLERFAALERKATDEVGWVALKLSCDRRTAQRRIIAARKKIEAEPKQQTQGDSPC